MGLIVNSVGDATCISLFGNKSISNDTSHLESEPESNEMCNTRVKGNKKFVKFTKNQHDNLIIDLLIDFGYYGSYSNKLDFQIKRSRDFLLTHFHRDHYNGFLKKDYRHCTQYDNQINFQHFYYQSLPSFKDSVIHQQLSFIVVIDNVFSLFFNRNNARNSSYWTLELLNINHNQNLVTVPCCWISGTNRGPIISSGYEVIWPLERYDEDILDFECWKKYVSYIENKIANLYEKAIKNKFIKDCETIFNDKIVIKDNSGKIDIFKTIGSVYRDIYNNHKDYIINILKFMNTKKGEIYDLQKEIKKIANHFSVCLYKEGELFTLGDLEDKDINPCILHFLSTHNLSQVNVKYFITAHHGTHWNTECNNINADYVISSNGRKMYDGCKHKYKDSLKQIYSNPNDIEKRFHNTYRDGDFGW